MLFKFVILFQSLMPLLMLCSLSSTCCYRLATRSHHSVQLLLLSTPLHSSQHTIFAPTCQQNRCNSARFCTIPLRRFVYSIPLLSAHPSFYFASQLFPQLHFANVVVKLLFPSTFFSLCHSNHTNQIAVSITQNCRLFRSNIITSTFTQKCHSAPHFDSTSAHHPLHHFIDFRPTILISTLNNFMLLVFNNVLNVLFKPAFSCHSTCNNTQSTNILSPQILIDLA